MKVPGGKPGDSVQCPRCSGTVVIVAAEAAQNPTAPASRDASSAGDIRNRLNPSTAGGGSETLVAAIPPADQRTPGRNEPTDEAEVPFAPEPPGPQTSTWRYNDDLICFDCLICGTRLTAHREEMGHRIACPDCGTMAVVPERRSSSRTRLAGTAQSSVPGKEADHVEEPLYRLQPPVQRQRPLPHLVDVREEELFANEPRLADPPRVAEQGGQATPPRSGEVAPSSKSHPPPLISDSEAAEVNAPKTAPPGKAPPGSMPARDHGTTREHAGAYLANAGVCDEAYHVECPLCGTQVLVWPNQVGQQVRCPDCTSTFPVPERVKRPHERTFPTREFPDEIRFLDDWPPTSRQGGKSRQVEKSRSGSISPPPEKLTSKNSGEDISDGGSTDEVAIGPEGGVKTREDSRPPRADKATDRGPSRAGNRVSQNRGQTPASAAPVQLPLKEQARSKLQPATTSKIAHTDIEETAPMRSDTQRLRRFLETPYILLLVRPLIQPQVLLCLVLAAVVPWGITILMQKLPDGFFLDLLTRRRSPLPIALILLLGYYWTTCMNIVTATANGMDRLEETIVPPLADIVTVVVGTVLAFAISGLPGLVVAAAVWSFWPESGFWVLVPCLGLSECICLPVVALSLLSSDQPGDFFCFDVLDALLQRKSDWVRYAIVLGLCWAATASSLLFYEVSWWPSLACVLWILTSFIHARALGIFAAQAILGTHESRGSTRKVAGGIKERKDRFSTERYHRSH